MQRIARIDHPEVRQVVPSHHCVVRFRQRRPLRERGGDAVADALIATLEDADVTRWTPPWAGGEQATELWAIAGDLAFPLQRTDVPGRYLAATCLSR